MGFFSAIIEDVFDVTEKVVRSPLRTLCVLEGDHDWEWDRKSKQYKCCLCAATQDK